MRAEVAVQLVGLAHVRPVPVVGDAPQPKLTGPNEGRDAIRR